jgi:hypothetical protein
MGEAADSEAEGARVRAVFLLFVLNELPGELISRISTKDGRILAKE